MTMVIRYPQMPRRMAEHYECLKATAVLERELFGAVVSESIVPQLEEYSWWPMAGPPPSVSITPPGGGYPSGDRTVDELRPPPLHLQSPTPRPAHPHGRCGAPDCGGDW